MYIRQETIIRIFAVRLQLGDPQETEAVLAAVQEKLAVIATEVVIESPLVTYDRELDTNTNVILNFFLHISNSISPEKVRLSEIAELLNDIAGISVISVKLD